MPIEDALFDKLRPWLNEATGLNVILAHPDAPAPQGEYLSVNLIAGTPLQAHAATFNYEEAAQPSGDGIKDLFQVPIAEHEWVWSVSIYAHRPMDVANIVAQWCTSDAAMMRLFPFAVQPVSQIRRIPEWHEGKWVGRAQFDLTMRGMLQHSEEGAAKIYVDEVLTGQIGLGPVDRPAFTTSADYEKPTGG